jgi:hypothetical protein
MPGIHKEGIMTKAIAELSRDRAFRAYAALTALHIALVWLIPHFPTQDGPSHVYNLVLLHDLVNGGRDWGRYFTYDFHAVPNLGFHLIAYPLIKLFPPYVTERIFISIYILLMTVSVPVFLRTFGNRAMPLSFLSFPLLFSFPFMMGFYSFTIAVPCMLLAMCAAWSLRTAPLTHRFFVLNLAGFGLFYMHLIPFIIYLLFICIMLTVSLLGRERPLWRQFPQVGLIAPSVMLFLYYLLTGRGGSHPESSYTLSLSRFLELLSSLMLFSLDTFSRWQLAAWIPLFLLVYLLAKTAWKDRGKSPDLRDGNRVLVFLSLTLLIFYFSLPVDFGGGDFFNQRFPWILFLLSLPLVKIPSSGVIGRFQMRIFPGIALLFFLVNSVILEQQSRRVDEFLSGMRADMPQGTFIATCKPVSKGWSRVDPLLHAASHYGIAKKCIDAGNYELSSALSPVRFRETAPPLPRQDYIAFYPDRIDWTRYPAVRFILGWKAHECGGPDLAKNFSLLMNEGRFSLWRRK